MRDFAKLLVFGSIAVIFVIAAWFVSELFRRFFEAIDGLGPLVFQVPVIVLIVCFCAVLIYVTVYLIRRLDLSARSVHPDRHTALYPQMRMRPGETWLDLNAPNAQVVAALPRSAKVAPQTFAQAIAPPAPAELPAPQWDAPAAQVSFPARVEVYDAPVPQELALPVGVDGFGRQVSLPLRGLGNVVIGGLPSRGKSEIVGSFIAGLLRQDPHGLRSKIAIIDPKLVSFGNLPALAALAWPVACTVEEAQDVIEAVRSECVRRYVMLREAGVRSLEEYVARTGEPLPYLTTVIDEIADLTCDPDRERRDRFLSTVAEVARKGRAAGVGLAMATQRPSVDVLPASLRNLAGAAIAFKVQRNHDSVAVLGEPGAENLPDIPGRCLVKRGATVECQAYASGLEGGRFDMFLSSVPRVDGLTPAPVRENVPKPPVQPVQPVQNQVQRLSRNTRPTPEQAALMRKLYGEGWPKGWSKNALCDAFWGYKNDVVLGYLNEALGIKDTP